jgi:hypothetical protein
MKLNEQIIQLTECEPTDSLFISLYLDTKDMKHNNYCAFLKNNYDFIFMEFLMCGGSEEIFNKYWEKILHFLKNNLKDSSEGLAMIIRLDITDSIFFVHEFPVPIENSVVVDGVPHIYPLMQLINEKILT